MISMNIENSIPVVVATGPSEPPSHEVTVLSVRDETPTVRSVRLCKPEGFDFRTSQAVRLFLRTEQRETYHPMSIASSPTKPYLEFAVRRTESEFKQAFFSLQPADRARIQGPRGRFFFDPAHPAVFVAGGIGITPLKSMIEFATDMQMPTRLTLLYSNRRASEIAFREELDAMSRSNPSLEIAYTVTRSHEGEKWEGRSGRIDLKWLREISATQPEARYYIAGTPGMVKNVMWALNTLGVPPDRMLQEMFKGYARYVVT
jgi:ferredoxin-NADP reductase